ncbi:MAG: STN domain-containing protein [Pirellulales bacterium]|nr:STN domain-containing protein [Pirellulales bacterium]
MKRRPGNYACLTVTALLSLTLLGGAVADLRAEDNRLNGRDFHQRLDRPLGVVWSEVPLRDALNGLSESQNVAVWLDRRIDPGRRISLKVHELPLRDVLDRIAHDQGLEMVLFHSVVYFGPPDAVKPLRTLGELRREEARKLPRATARRLYAARSMRWEDLATPGELLDTLTTEGHLEIADRDHVVHDLWPANVLPSMTLVDRLTLMLASLGLTFEYEEQGARIRLIPIPGRVALVRRYPAGVHPQDVVHRWSQTAPESRIRIDGDSIVVEGRLEDHERITQSRRSNGRRTTGDRKRAGTSPDDVRIVQPKFEDQRLESAIRQVAAQLKLELVFDAEGLRRSGIDLDRRISLELKGEATIDELFRAILEPAGLTFRRRGSTVEIRAARR